VTGTALDADILVRRSDAFALSVRLEAAAGEIVAVMGPSGAGKSTLLGALAGFVEIDGGRIRLGDLDVAIAGDGSRSRSVAPARRGIVLLGQDPRLFPHLSAADNVAFGLRAHGTARETARAAAHEWLARVGLPDAGARRPAELSGGQQQRVALARALASQPRLVLLDEPLTSLDPDTADGIRTVIQSALDCTAVVVTHAAVDALTLAHRLVVIEDGRVSQDGPVRDVLAAPATGFIASLAGLVWVEGVLRGGAAEVAGIRLPGAVAPGLAEGDAVAAVFRPGDVRLSARIDAGGSVGAGGFATDSGSPVADEASGGGGMPGAGSASGGDRPSGAAAPPSAAGGATWTARVRRLEPTLAGVRVRTEAPAVAVDVPLEAVAALGLQTGAEVALGLAASAVRILPAGPAAPAS
jgi:molybdate transport system ATP-binding protein